MAHDPEYEDWILADLIPHPKQQIYFKGLDEHGLKELAEDIERNGLKEPIEILPDGTIVSGHQRLAALQLLEIEEIEVYVRHDLADSADEEIERYLLDSNQNRQHLSTLEQARIALRVYEIEKGRSRDKLSTRQEVDARDRVGQQIGMSGRNLQRYWRVLQTPLDVQNAFERRELTLVDASRVAGLSEEEQEEIAERIHNGESPREVVKEFFDQQDGPKPIDQVLRRFRRSLETSLDEIEPRLEDVKTAPPVGLITVLELAATFIPKLLKRCRKNQEDQERKVEQLMKEGFG